MEESFPLPPLNVTGGLSPATGNLDPIFNASVTEGDGFVDDLVVQPDGKIIIVGSFQRVNGTPVNNIARLHADGTLDPSFDVGTGPNSAIRTVAVRGSPVSIDISPKKPPGSITATSRPLGSSTTRARPFRTTYIELPDAP